MDPCVNCGTVEPVVPVPSCDCQTLNPCGGDARETRLLAPTRHEHDKWAANNPILSEGVLGLVKDRLYEGSIEYIIGDGEHTYTELLEEYRIYAGAPLSRTGAENHSPLAASGKSTLDPSWLPAATSNALGAVMVSTTGAAGKVPIPASGSSTLDSSWLPVSTSGAANKIPIADNNGKLDPSWLPEATSTTLGGVKASTTTAANNVVKADANGSLDGWKDAIVNTIENENGGLVVDPNTGDLMVDFSQMPTDKFEALLKGLKMLIPMTTDKAFYVNQEHANASDNTEDIVVGTTAYNRGSEQYPFKTIQACINYVTQTYSVGTRRPSIRVVRGPQQLPYNENLSLPTYTRTSGYITLQAADDTAPPTINNTGAISRTIEVSGETWVLRRLTIHNTVTDPDNGLSNFPSSIYCYGGSTTLNLFGCAISQEYVGAAPASGWVEPRTIEVEDGATFVFHVLSGYQNSLSCVKGNANRAVMLQSSRKAKILFASANTTDDGICYDIPCAGTVTVFAAAGSAASMEGAGGGLHRVTFSGSVTGNTYVITGGAYIAAPVGGFPATGTGSVETDTYCWYKQAS